MFETFVGAEVVVKFGSVCGVAEAVVVRNDKIVVFSIRMFVVNFVSTSASVVVVIVVIFVVVIANDEDDNGVKVVCINLGVVVVASLVLVKELVVVKADFGFSTSD